MKTETYRLCNRDEWCCDVGGCYAFATMAEMERHNDGVTVNFYCPEHANALLNSRHDGERKDDVGEKASAPVPKA